MQIGILSDSHDNERALQKAVAFFEKEKIKIILHAGDLCSPLFIPYFSSFDFYLAQGNNDNSLQELNQALLFYNLRECKIVHEIEILQKRICLMHGDNVPLFRQKLLDNTFDYLIKGHTHFCEDYYHNQTRILNSGAMHRSPQNTFGILDLEKNAWSIHVID